MKKSKAIIILLCALLVLLGVGYVDLYGVDAEGTASASDISLGLDLAGGVSITYQVVGDEEPDATDMADTIAKLQKRVENYSKEAIVYQEGTDRINIEIPGVTDANKILEELGRPGSLYFIAETDKDGNANYSMQAVTDAQGNVSYAYALNKTIDELKADGSIMLEGTDVKTATAGSIKDQTMGNSTYAVDLVMTEEGTKKFEEATRNAYEKGETLGIYYDGSFVSVPSVKGVFSDGNAQISPMNSYEEAEAGTGRAAFQGSWCTAGSGSNLHQLKSSCDRIYRSGCFHDRSIFPARICFCYCTGHLCGIGSTFAERL